MISDKQGIKWVNLWLLSSEFHINKFFRLLEVGISLPYACIVVEVVIFNGIGKKVHFMELVDEV